MLWTLKRSAPKISGATNSFGPGCRLRNSWASTPDEARGTHPCSLRRLEGSESVSLIACLVCFSAVPWSLTLSTSKSKDKWWPEREAQMRAAGAERLLVAGVSLIKAAKPSVETPGIHDKNMLLVSFVSCASLCHVLETLPSLSQSVLTRYGQESPGHGGICLLLPSPWARAGQRALLASRSGSGPRGDFGAIL